MGFEKGVSIGREAEGGPDPKSKEEIDSQVLEKLDKKRGSSPVAQYLLNLSPAELQKLDREANAMGDNLYMLTDTEQPELVVDCLKKLLTASPFYTEQGKKQILELRKQIEGVLN